MQQRSWNILMGILQKRVVSFVEYLKESYKKRFILVCAPLSQIYYKRFTFIQLIKFCIRKSNRPAKIKTIDFPSPHPPFQIHRETKQNNENNNPIKRTLFYFLYTSKVKTNLFSQSLHQNHFLIRVGFKKKMKSCDQKSCAQNSRTFWILHLQQKIACEQMNEVDKMIGELSQYCRYINAATKIKDLIINQTTSDMSQSQQPSQIPQSTQNKQLNIGQGCSSETFKLELLASQAAYLTKLLPTSYSFQVQPKSLKRGVSTTKSQKQQTKVPLQPKKQPTKSDVKNINLSKSSLNRAQKSSSTRFTQENENAIYEKYSTQKDYRRNSFENVSQTLKPCVKILNLLKNSKTSWPFREPVDPIALGIPHYTQIIKEPMDLSTIENNLRTNQYITPTQFHADVAKIVTNSYTFNALNPQFTHVTREFEAYYQKIRTQPGSDLGRTYSIQQEIPTNIYSSKISNLQNKKMKKETKEVDYTQPASQTITMNEKKELGLNIKKLPKEYMKGILEIVNEGRQKNIVEFDLKELDNNIIRNLQLYVKEKLSGQTKVKGNLATKPKQHEEESSFQVGQQSQS